MSKTVFIFTHRLFANYGEYINYVEASSKREAFIKLFKFFNNREHFYEIVSLIANRFQLTDDEIGYNKINHDDDVECEAQLREIVARLNRKFVPDEDTMYDVINWHLRENIQKTPDRLKSLEHQITYLECKKLQDVLIS